MLMLRRFTEQQKKTFRHWLMEFVIVVTGVLLALWMQDWWERRRASSDLEAAEEAIHNEVRNALMEVIWRKAISECHVDRQELLKSMLLQSGENWPGLQENALAARTTVPTTVVPSIYTRPYDSFATAAWTSALTTGALAPMDSKRFGELVAIYDQIDAWRSAREDESEAVSKMSSLAFPMRLTPELKAQMIESVYRVDRARFGFAIVGPDDLAHSMRELGWDDAEEIDVAIQKESAEIKASGNVFRPCVRPMTNPFREKAALAGLR